MQVSEMEEPECIIHCDMRINSGNHEKKWQSEKYDKINRCG